MSSSTRTWPQICRNSFSMVRLNAFMASGRFSVTLATLSLTSKSTVLVVPGHSRLLLRHATTLLDDKRRHGMPTNIVRLLH